MPQIAPLKQADKGLKDIQGFIDEIEDSSECADDKTFYEKFKFDLQDLTDGEGYFMNGFNEEGKDLAGYDEQQLNQDGRKKNGYAGTDFQKDCSWSTSFTPDEVLK